MAIRCPSGALLDRDDLPLTSEERQKLREAIDLVMWPYLQTVRLREKAIADVEAERRAARERRGREGAGG